MKNKAAKQKSKKKGSDNVFGCDLTEHLQNSGQDVPQVLKTCAEFIEKHGIVDGIYRLSGVTSNIQRLRQEFCSESCPNLTKEVYLQDIHCVGSLCKLYFRELPNPLLTYELYKKFTDAVLVQGDDEKLLHIQSVIKELPVPHFRTLEFLTKHLAHLATLSPETNMHARNLALVWAPNLLRFKEIDVSTCSGDKAFQEVRVQQSVVEFILNHTEQIFNHGVLQTKPIEGQHLVCGDKYATLPISGQSGPMKLMSLEEAQARTLSPNHPARKERQRENSLPDTSTANLYHTVIDISDNKRKFSGKSKKWKSIFNLGKSVGDSKGKLSRNGSVFMRAHHSPEKAAMRPARSMDSLCSLPTDDDKAGNFNSAGGANGLLVPGMKSRTLGSDTLYDLSEQDQKWEFDRRNASGATGGCSPNVKRRVSPGASAPLHKALPEQLKVFKGEDISGCEPTSPKNRRMLYSGSSHNNASRPSFPGSIFPLESSPRHQRKALNISEPFAVSVPLRVSAVISVNSTPCRASGKDKTTAAALKPCRDATRSDLSDSSGGSGFRETTLGEGSWGSEFSDLNKSSSIQQLDDEERQDETEKRKEETIIKMVKEDLAGKDEVLLGEAEVTSIKPSFPNQKDTTLTPEADTVHTPGKHLDDEGMPPHKLTDAQLDKEPSPIDKELWFDVNQELKIIEPEIGILNEEFKLFFCSTKNPCEGVRPKPDAQSKRRSSLPTCSLLYKGQTPVPSKSITTNVAATGKHSARKLPSESNTLSSFYRSFDFIPKAEIKYPISLSPDAKEKSKSKLPYNTEKGLQNIPQWQDKKPLPKENAKTGITDGIVDQVPCGVIARNVGEEADGILHRHSICMERKGITLESTHLDNEEGSGANYEELDMVEPWEDCCLSKQWVTSPLHSPTLKDLFGKLNTSQTSSVDLTVNCANTPLVPVSSKQINRTHSVKCPQPLAANSLQTCSGNTVTMGTNQQLLPTEMSMAKTDAAQPDQENISASKPRNTKSFQKFHRQMSHDTSCSEKREGNYFPKHRPFSLNLDLGHRCIRDISNQQHHQFSEVSSNQRELQSQVQTKHYRRSMELEMFLKDHQAPVRRNSAPVSVISVRTAFMIKTSQAKAVPVIPPKVQYSHIPHPKCDKVSDTLKGHEKDRTKTRSIESETGPPPQWNKDFKEELENKEPAAKSQKQQKAEETCETASILEIPVLRRKRLSNVDAYADCLRPDRPNVIQRPSFRNRQRPQSLILFSPPFPIMDYPSLGDDGKFLLSPIKCPTEVPALDVFSNKMADNLRTPEEVILRNKMTIPKIGQRLETSTSCFYQPQRRSMIFDNRSHRQIE